jgi:hypothetical protein
MLFSSPIDLGLHSRIASFTARSIRCTAHRLAHGAFYLDRHGHHAHRHGRRRLPASALLSARGRGACARFRPWLAGPAQATVR